METEIIPTDNPDIVIERITTEREINIDSYRSDITTLQSLISDLEAQNKAMEWYMNIAIDDLIRWVLNDKILENQNKINEAEEKINVIQYTMSLYNQE